MHHTVIVGEALKTRGKTFEQNLLENCSKSTKMAIAVCKFSKILRGEHAPGPPKSNFCSSIYFKLILPEKMRLKNYRNLMPSSLKKLLNTPLA